MQKSSLTINDPRVTDWAPWILLDRCPQVQLFICIYFVTWFRTYCVFVTICSSTSALSALSWNLEGGKKKTPRSSLAKNETKLFRHLPSTFLMPSFFLIKPYNLGVISDSTRNKKTGSLFSATQLLVPHKPLIFSKWYCCRSGLSLCPWAQHAQATFILSALREDGPMSQVLTDKMSLVGNGTVKRNDRRQKEKCKTPAFMPHLELFELKRDSCLTLMALISSSQK